MTLKRNKTTFTIIIICIGRKQRRLRGWRHLKSTIVSYPHYQSCKKSKHGQSQSFKLSFSRKLQHNIFISNNLPLPSNIQSLTFHKYIANAGSSDSSKVHIIFRIIIIAPL